MSRANLTNRLFIRCISSGERCIIQFSVLVQWVINEECLGRGGCNGGAFYRVDPGFLRPVLPSPSVAELLSLPPERALSPADGCCPPGIISRRGGPPGPSGRPETAQTSGEDRWPRAEAGEGRDDPLRRRRSSITAGRAVLSAGVPSHRRHNISTLLCLLIHLDASWALSSRGSSERGFIKERNRPWRVIYLLKSGHPP